VLESILSVFGKITHRRNQDVSALTEAVADSFFPRPSLKSAGTPAEIQDRLRSRYIDRLFERVRKMRKDLAARNWAALKLECRQLGASGESYGLAALAEQARKVDSLIPESDISKARILPDARAEVEILIQQLDAYLNTQT